MWICTTTTHHMNYIYSGWDYMIFVHYIAKYRGKVFLCISELYDFIIFINHLIILLLCF